MNKSALLVSAILAAFTLRLTAQELEIKPKDPFFEKFAPIKAPFYHGCLLRPGDRLAIIGDSITEALRYSDIIETYLTVCKPELKMSVRQFGWSGETAEGFLHRMTNDCLRFQPTVATLCYGMNDHGYDAYHEDRAQWYRSNYTAVAHSLRERGVRVVLGSPGCIGRIPPWISHPDLTVEDLNLTLCRFRNLDIGIAKQENARFADMFWPMLTIGHAAQQKYGTNFILSGRFDGVHPGWDGHVVMAYVFLRAMGLDGDLGTFTVDLGNGSATTTAGHTVESFTNNQLTIVSTKYPFCARGSVTDEDSWRSGTALMPFFQDLSRLMLVVMNGRAEKYTVIWGNEKRVYSAAQLAAGVNLAEDFEKNPFCDAFANVESAVASKQNYETVQIKNVFRTPAAQADPDRIAKLSDKVREPLVDAIAKAFVPVTHIIKIEPQ